MLMQLPIHLYNENVKCVLSLSETNAIYSAMVWLIKIQSAVSGQCDRKQCKRVPGVITEIVFPEILAKELFVNTCQKHFSLSNCLRV